MSDPAKVAGYSPAKSGRFNLDDASVEADKWHRVPVAAGVIVPADRHDARGHAGFRGPRVPDTLYDIRRALVGAGVRAGVCRTGVPGGSDAGSRGERKRIGVRRLCVQPGAQRHWTARTRKGSVPVARVSPGHGKPGDWPPAV